MKTQREDLEKIYGARYGRSFDGYLILWPNGERVKPTWVTRAFHRFLKETNLIRFHGLRHSCAAPMRREGVPMEDIHKGFAYDVVSLVQTIGYTS